MAAGTVSRDIRESDNDKAFIKCTWILTSADPTGALIAIPDFNDKNWTIGNAAGDSFGVAAVCSLQGSNVLADTLVTLNKAAGGATATALAAAVINTIENTLFVAPVLTTPSSGATVTVTLIARRSNILRN